jgi:hypothetical protein
VQVGGLGVTLGNLTVPKGSKGNYRYRKGDITPRLGWGMARDITVGKYSVRPSAGIALKVGFDENEYNLTDSDGKEYHYEDFSKNTLTPIVEFDTGGAELWSGQWGAISLGISETFEFTIAGEGTSHPKDEDHQGLDTWKNNLAPYAKFSYDVAPGLSLGAKLSIPVIFGAEKGTKPDPGSGTYGVSKGYVGIGYYAGSSSQEDNIYPELGIGVQYVFTKEGVFGDAVDKMRLDQKLRFNLGINVFLPGYRYGSDYTYDDHEVNADAITIREKREARWFQGFKKDASASDVFLQLVSFGVQFAPVPNFVIDAAIEKDFSIGAGGGGGGSTDLTGKVLLSVKY